MNNITIKDLVKVLSELPDKAKEMEIQSICGCSDGKGNTGFQFTLNAETKNHNKYVIIPSDRYGVMYDSFGERKII